MEVRQQFVNLLMSTDARESRENIKRYNSALAFSSLQRMRRTTLTLAAERHDGYATSHMIKLIVPDYEVIIDTYQ